MVLLDIHSWAAALKLALLLVLPGAGWTWLLPTPPARRFSTRMLVETGRALALGVPAVLVTLVAILEFGGNTARLLPAAVLAGMIGMAAGWHFRPERRKSAVPPLMAGLALLWILFSGLLLRPAPGEWIPGGWDPGVYMNTGIRAALDHSAQPRLAEPLQALDEPLLARALEPITDNRGTTLFQEAFPGIPFDPQARAYSPYFFRLTSTWISLFTLAGGPDAALRAHAVIALLALWIIVAVAFMAGGGWYALFAGLLLIFQPVFAYHLHLPTSEMPHLFLLAAILLLLPQRARPVARAGLALLFLAGMLNRIDFFPLGALLVGSMTLLDQREPESRRSMALPLLLMGTLILGVALDALWLSPLAVARLGSVFTSLLAVGGFICVAVLIFPFVLRLAPVRPLPIKKPRRFSVPPGLVGTLIAIMVLVAVLPVVREVIRTVLRLLPFFGWPALVLVGAGVLWMIFSAAPESRPLRYALWAPLLLCAATLYEGHIAEILPWASRRQFPYLALALALGGGGALAALWSARGVRRIFAGILLLAAVLIPIRTWWHGLARTEFNGAAVALQQIATQLGPRDVVIADDFRWGTPLMFVHGATVLNGRNLLNTQSPDDLRANAEICNRLSAAGWRIRWLTSSPIAPQVMAGLPLPAQLDWTSGPIRLAEIIHGDDARDFQTRPLDFAFRLYSLPAGRRISEEDLFPRGRFELDIGSEQAVPWLLDGFYLPETDNGIGVRWSSNQATVGLFYVPTGGAQRICVQFTDQHCPAPVAASNMTLVINGRALRPDIEPVAGRPGWKQACVIVPEGIIQAVTNRLQWQVPMWRPFNVTGAKDYRRLGIMVDRVEAASARVSGDR